MKIQNFMENCKLNGKIAFLTFFNKDKIKHGKSEKYNELLKSNNQYLVFMNLLSDDDKCSSGIIMPTPKDVIVGSNEKLHIRSKSELSYLCVPLTFNN